MSRIKRVAGAVTISAAMLMSVAPAASAAEPAEHCFPIVDHPVICFVVCTVQQGSLKACDVQITCNYELLPTACAVVEEVWRVVP